MPRVKRGTLHHKRRANIIEYTKGFRWGRKSKLAAAKQAMMKALSYNYRDRKVKKRDARAMWNIHINAICRKNGTNYSQFIGALKKNNIAIDRKILSELSATRPDLFETIMAKAAK
ncbi:MAG: 50S ribosomal protein L20 [Candidatus Pacebacteria bacterium]|jgi:large subunit ribosomal protein L20|nr:50S ribosomal protein L20 [Candidatus Paceibacterota bacterium]